MTKGGVPSKTKSDLGTTVPSAADFIIHPA
jgi:hypothetical protein